jgi:osmotically-inducible protein OsmY
MPRVSPFVVAACALLGCSNALTRRAPPPSDPDVADAVLVARVNHALRAAGVDGYATVRILAANGAVTLEGSLASTALVELALRTTREVQGVASVTNRLVAAEAAG